MGNPAQTLSGRAYITWLSGFRRLSKDYEITTSSEK